MDFERARPTNPDVNLSALIDIAFILVIFIILGASFQQVNAVDLALPTASTKDKPESKTLKVRIESGGKIEVDGRQLDSRDPAQLAALLRGFRKQHDALLLVADGQAAIQNAITVMDAAQQAGFGAVSIATQEP